MNVCKCVCIEYACKHLCHKIIFLVTATMIKLYVVDIDE